MLFSIFFSTHLTTCGIVGGHGGHLAGWFQHRTAIPTVRKLFPLPLQSSQRSKVQMIVMVRIFRLGITPTSSMSPVTPTVVSLVMMMVVMGFVRIRGRVHVRPVQAGIRIGRGLGDGFVRGRAVTVGAGFTPVASTSTTAAYRVLRSGSTDKAGHATMLSCLDEGALKKGLK